MSRLNDATPEDWDKANRTWLKGNTQLCPAKALDKQEGGTHYKNYKIQPMEYIQANNLGYAEGNVVKYITRYQDKNGIEDLLKAIHYIDLIIEDLKERK
ncbi:MAG: DUF3310 domain-containing protein [Reichenbachiella sp.]